MKKRRIWKFFNKKRKQGISRILSNLLGNIRRDKHRQDFYQKQKNMKLFQQIRHIFPERENIIVLLLLLFLFLLLILLLLLSLSLLLLLS